jgi:hypothetical protein
MCQSFAAGRELPFHLFGAQVHASVNARVRAFLRARAWDCEKLIIGCALRCDFRLFVSPEKKRTYCGACEHLER